ncbi:hypothetical protein [Thermasporomyces composti]|uniref:hypothetical protein n=1 Tax=Thermasporomyces composti TaxID=696763 RepID=UPI000E230415|nr:hypothetical protein [Thermasporomyces composti]
MSRRRPRGRRSSGQQPRPLAGGYERVEEWPDGEWVVRQITGSTSVKSYRCPGCDQLIPPATPHIVAWPVEPLSFVGSGLDERRHWHTSCWRARDRRWRR